MGLLYVFDPSHDSNFSLIIVIKSTRDNSHLDTFHKLESMHSHISPDIDVA